MILPTSRRYPPS